MPEVKVLCPSCRTAYWVDDQHLDETADCQQCSKPFIIRPALQEAVPAGQSRPSGRSAERIYIFRLGMHLVRILPGSFRMGSERGYAAERPLRQVHIAHTYWLGEFPVTQAAWEPIMGNNPSRFRSPNRPVESITWHAAQEFCHRLNHLLATAGEIPDGTRFRLPTEAEWEFACVTDPAGAPLPENARDPFAVGDGMMSASRMAWLRTQAWFDDNSNGETKDVGGKPPDPRGLYDMLGNVGEWCADWYAPYETPGTAVEDPYGPTRGERKVRRGGCYSSIAGRCRANDRLGVHPHTRSPCLGFRIALS